MLCKEYFEMLSDASWIILNKKVHAIQVVDQSSALELLLDPVH